MPLLSRLRLALTTRPGSIHDLHGVQTIARDCLVRDDGVPVAVLACHALPLTLGGDVEGDEQIERFRRTLLVETRPVQLLIDVDTLDVEEYCVAHAAALAGEPVVAVRRLGEDHRAFMQDLAATSHLRQRHVYLVIAGIDASGTDLAQSPAGRPWRRPAGLAAAACPSEHAVRDLTDRCADWEHRLRGAGIDARRLDEADLAALLYRLLCPGLARRQPLLADLTALATGPVQAPAHQHRTPATGRRPRPAPAAEQLVTRGFRDSRDRLAPGAAQETPDWLRVDDRYALTVAVIGYPRQVSADWLRPLLMAGLSLRVSLHLTPIDSAIAKRQLAARRGRLGGSQAMAARQGYAERARERIAEQDIDQLEELIELDQECLLAGACSATVQAESLPALEAAVKELERLLGGCGLRSIRLRHEQARGYRATLPLGLDEPRRPQNLTTAVVAAAYPFAARGLEPGSVFLGIDQFGGGLVGYHPRDPRKANHHVGVFGPPGEGKSYAVKRLLLSSLALDPPIAVWVVDREGEYLPLCQAVGGRVIRLSTGAGGAGLNPLELPPPPEDDDRDGLDPLAERTDRVAGLTGLLVGTEGGKLTPDERALVELAVTDIYARWGITGDPGTHDRPVPTLADVQEWLAHADGPGQRLARTLHRFTHGPYAGLFARRTEVTTDGRMVVWDVRDLPDDLEAAGLYLLADALWTLARRQRADRTLVVDEAWKLVASPAGGRFLAEVARRGRKHNLRLITISQDVRDMLENPHGRAIAAFAATTILLPQNRRTIEPLTACFGLGEGQRELLLRARRGEALLLEKERQVALRVLASPEEDALITTAAEVLLERAAARRAAHAALRGQPVGPGPVSVAH